MNAAATKVAVAEEEEGEGIPVMPVAVAEDLAEEEEAEEVTLTPKEPIKLLNLRSQWYALVQERLHSSLALDPGLNVERMTIPLLPSKPLESLAPLTFKPQRCKLSPLALPM
jgi:hypothetical protein